MGIFLRNWHLKLGAVFLATVLYTGLVFSGSFTEQRVAGVPVTMVGQPDDWVPLIQLETVEVRFRAAVDSARLVFPESFTATVDFDDYDESQPGQPQSLPVSVRPNIDGVTVLSVVPATVTVAMDPVTSRSIPVRVERGPIPEGLEISDPTVSVEEVTARGAATLLDRVDHAQARVSVDPSGINIEAQVELVPVDINGEPVQGRIELNPSTATVEIEVERVETRKTVPITPRLTGTPAGGYSLTSITVEPAVVTLVGLPADLSGISAVDTEAVSVDGITEGLTADVDLILPDGVRLADGAAGVSVTVAVTSTEVTRTFGAAVVCTGAPSDSSCLPAQGQVAVTFSGPVATLSALAAGDVVVTVDVSGLGPGQHTVTPSVAVPAGAQLQAISPSSVTVTIVPPQPPPPPSPTPTPAP